VIDEQQQELVARPYRSGKRDRFDSLKEAHSALIKPVPFSG